MAKGRFICFLKKKLQEPRFPVFIDKPHQNLQATLLMSIEKIQRNSCVLIQSFPPAHSTSLRRCCNFPPNLCTLISIMHTKRKTTYSLQRIITSTFWLLKKIPKKCSLQLPFGTLSSGYLSCYLMQVSI